MHKQQLLLHYNLELHVHVCLFPSMQMAEEVLKSGPVDGEERGKEGGGVGEGRAAFEGMEALARAIETGRIRK